MYAHDPYSYRHSSIERAIKTVAERAVWYEFNSLMMCKRCRRWWYPKAGDSHKCANASCPDNKMVVYVFPNGVTAVAFDGKSKPVKKEFPDDYLYRG